MKFNTNEPLAESFDDMLTRLRAMASGDPTWDLSKKDRYAIQYALEELQRLEDMGPAWVHCKCCFMRNCK